MEKFTFKLALSFMLFAAIFMPAGAIENTFVSISPAMTEIMYALGAESQLKAVSDECDYPKAAQNKEKIGSGYFINNEKIIKLHPNYILALDSSEILLNVFKRFNITPLCFKYPNTEAIEENILKLGKLTGKEKRAEEIVKLLNKKIASAKAKDKKKILYLLNAQPIITVGKKSFLNDIIEKSGRVSIAGDLNIAYPVISEEYAIKQNPDVIVALSYLDIKRIKTLFPKAKIVVITAEQESIISRPGPRIYKAIEFFAGL